MSLEAELKQAHKERLARISAKAFVPPPVVVVPEPEPTPEPEPVAEPQRTPWFRIIHAPRVTIRDIQDVVADFYGTTREMLCAPKRTKALCRCRFIAVYLANEITGKTYPEIGMRFGNRDKATIVHAIDTVHEQIKTDAQLVAELDMLRCRIGALS